MVLRLFFSIYFILCLLPAAVHADRPVLPDSLETAGLTMALAKIFSHEKIATILSKLPPKSKIFGFDYGDFSGDDGMDVVLSTRNPNAFARTLDVYFFINEGAEFELIHTVQRKYIAEAIEVGFSIEQGVCHVTEKIGEFNWRITGYSMAEGLFRRVSEWTTQRLRSAGGYTSIGFEQSHDYLGNITWERYYGVNTGRTFLDQRFYVLPVYPQSLDIPGDIPLLIGDTTAGMVVYGGSSWYGPDDSHFLVSARYDSSSVVFDIHIHDDRLLWHKKTDSADYFALYFDLSGQPRLRRDGSPQQYGKNTQLALILMMGDGETYGPELQVQGGKGEDSLLTQISVTMTSDSLIYNSWHFSLRVPVTVFSHRSVLQDAGFCAVYHDVDHDSRRDWVTLLSSSPEYHPEKPHTYGRINFFSNYNHVFERLDLRTRFLARRLRSAGVL